MKCVITAAAFSVIRVTKSRWMWWAEM